LQEKERKKSICVSIIPIFVYLWRNIQKMGKFRVFLTWKRRSFPMGNEEFPNYNKLPQNGDKRNFTELSQTLKISDKRPRSILFPGLSLH